VATFIEIRPLSKQTGIASCEICVKGRTDGRTTWNHNASAAYCWRWRHKN